MKKNITQFLFSGFILLLSCGSSNVEDKTAEPVTAAASANNQRGDGIVGKWKEQSFTSDDNGNYQVDEDERKQAKAPIIDVYLNLNADGSCSLTAWTKKGHYELITDDERKKIYIYDDASGEDNHFYITSVGKTELVLYNVTSGVFHIYKRI